MKGIKMKKLGMALLFAFAALLAVSVLPLQATEDYRDLSVNVENISDVDVDVYIDGAFKVTVAPMETSLVYVQHSIVELHEVGGLGSYVLENPNVNYDNGTNLTFVVESQPRFSVYYDQW